MGRRQVAIVTGSESGIGKATAVALAAAGFDVGVTWHRERAAGEETVRLVHQAGGRAALRELDLRQVSSATAVVESLADELGSVDALINNAAVLGIHDALDITEAEFRHVLDVDVVGTFFVAQVVARRMIEAGRGGRIVNVTSVHEHVPAAGAVAYTAAKHALAGITKGLALELAPYGITVNSVAPGPIATRPSDDPDEEPRPHSVPLGRHGRAAEVASTIVHLVVAGSYVTGSSFTVDGGLLLGGGPPPPGLGSRLLRRALGRA